MKKSVSPPGLKVGNSDIILKETARIAVLKVSPVDIELKTDGEQKALQEFYQELLDTVTYPLYLYSRQHQIGLDEYIDRVNRGDGFNRLRSTYLDYCRQLTQHGFVATDHFIIVRVTEVSHDSHEELSRRVQEVMSIVSGGDLSVEQVSGDDLMGFTKDAMNRCPVLTENFCATPNEGFNEFRKMVYVEEYPARIDFGWPRHLLQVDGLVDVTQVVQPVEVGKATKKLRRQSEKLDAEIAAFLSSGHHGVNRLERSLDDVEWFLDLLAKQECRPVRVGVYITAHAETREQVEQTIRNVKTRLRTLQVAFQEPGPRNDHAYYTDSPFYADRLNERLLMPSVSAATGFPFGTQPLEDSNGVIFGTSIPDGTPILIDRFTWDSHSMAVMGTLGSGKSYSSKLNILRSLLVYPELRVIVVDPKKEYRGTVEAMGGDHRFVLPGNEYRFDEPVLGFEVEERGEFENVAALVDLVQQIYAATSKNREKTVVVIDEARLLLEDDHGRDVLNQFVLEARDINTSVHMVTQSASHFTDWRMGRDILKHAPGRLLFRHEDISDSMIDYFNLSEQEKSDLLRLRTGGDAGYSEAILRVQNALKTKVKVESTELEHQVIEKEPDQPRMGE